MSCPICGSDRLQLITNLQYSKSFLLKIKGEPPSELNHCLDCGHRFIQLKSDFFELAEAAYNSDYKGYRSDPAFQSAIKEQITKNFLPRISPPARILDIGCGNGDFMIAALDVGYQVMGLDISKAAVDFCQKKGLNAIAGNFLEQQIESNFDFVTMWDVIEHLEYPQSFIYRAFELLRPGGYFVAKTPCVANQTFSMVKTVPRLGGVLLQAPDHIQFFSQETLAMVFNQAGFKSIDCTKAQGMRSLPAAGNIKTALARFVKTSIYRLGDNGNFYIVAQKPVTV